NLDEMFEYQGDVFETEEQSMNSSNEDRKTPAIYRLKADEIIDGRMVINPHAKVARETKSVEAWSMSIDETLELPQEAVNDELYSEVDSASEPEQEETEDEAPRMGRIRRALGRVASLGRSLNVAYVNGVTKALGAFPGSASEEEVYERNKLLREKYAKDSSDNVFKRGYKLLRRNQYQIASWTPVAFLGAIALERFASVGMSMYSGNSIRTEAIPYETLPYEHTVQSTDIIVGGHTQGDPVASGYVGMLDDAGLYNPENNNVPIYWSAQMAPLPGDTLPMTASDAEGAQKIVDAVYDAGGAPVRIFAFSQGTEATLRGLNQIADNNGGRVPDNITVILTGTPSGDLGLGKNVGVQAVDPILKGLGIETDQPIPPGANIIVRTDIADAFGNGGNQSLLKLGEMAVGPGHTVVGPENGVLMYSYEKDGVTYEVWGDPQGINDPLLRFARNQGMYVSPQAEAFMEAAMPYTPPGATEPVYTDATNVTQAGAALIDDTIKFNTGYDSTIARDVTNGVMTPERTEDLQNVLDLQKIPDQFAEIVNNPATMRENSQAIQSELQNAANTVKEYIPSETNHPVRDIINDGLKGAGINIQLPEPRIHHIPTPPAPAPVPTPAPVPFIPPAPAPAPTPIRDAVNNFLGNLNIPAPAPAPAPAPFIPAPTPPPAPILPNLGSGDGPVRQFLRNLRQR
ncbi:PE-PPE domain-containing protein, partial [Candidatus Saccharibacteria bacterium]|nr:PE-PPE domain-containing protein [Candidatus Saccharibacteria bacterium]